MGCLSNRSKQTRDFADQKWDHIHLDDFKVKGCGSPFAYTYLWFSLILSIAVYGVDCFTAVNLIVFDRWSSTVGPAISLTISRWIFTVCIILSFVNLGYEAWRAIRVMRRGNVAECYLDSLAVRWESIRLGNGQGFKRFLVFAELTKSKKGAEYIAIFTYFNLKSWIRVILCSGPRQVVNAFTLRSVYMADLASSGNFEHSIEGFFNNIKTLATHNYQEAVILSGMCFTLVIWVFSALFLLAAVLFYVFFLFHWIPRSDGGLTGYCERKVNKALLQIVTKTVNKALAKEENNRIKAEIKAAKKNGGMPDLARVGTGTLPTLPNVGPVSEDKLPGMPMLGRNDTTTTLPPYESRPATPGSIELGSMDVKRPMPSRTATTVSNVSYSSRAPLIGGAADMGYSGSGSPEPTLPNIDLGNLPPQRPGTSNSQRSFGGRPPMRHLTTDSNSSLRTPFTESPGPFAEPMSAFAPPMRSPTSRTMDYPTSPDGRSSPAPAPKQYQAYSPGGLPNPPASANSYRGGPPPGAPRQPPALNQPPYQPMRSATGPVPPRGPQNPPSRNMTATAPMPSWGAQTPVQRNMGTPGPSRGPQNPPQRNMTAPIPSRGPEGDYFSNAPGWQDSRGALPPQNYGSPRPPQGQRGAPYGYDVESQRSRGY